MLVAGGDGALPEIIQTRRGEILVYRGHRYSKISLGGHRKYWRCTKRPCRAKIHTDLHTGAVLHISEVHTHGAPVEKTLKDRIEGLFYYQRAALPAAADSTGSPSTSGGAALVACSPFSSPTELVDHVVVFPLEGSSGHVRVPVEYEHMEVWFWPASFDDLPHLESHLVIYHLREIATACQNEAFSALASLLFDIPQEQMNKYHYVHSVEGGLAPELRRMLFDAHCREVADKLRCDADVPRGFVCRGDDNGVRGFGLFVDAANDGARALRSRLESSGRLHEWVPGVKYESGEEWAGEGEEEESREREWRRLRAWLAREAVGRPAARVRPRDELLRAPPACVTARLLTALESSSSSSSLPPATDAGGPWPAITFVLPLDGAVVAARRGDGRGGRTRAGVLRGRAVGL
ncbi:PREDICTED: uncharacterized protein LOC106814363 [Priapulus caudatus]|uniref:Uncharacterized protein LOC106814363 n=1 Tax=Priapulus caudatus TaxID=37621 RepID=A0ABM1EPP2_PRICU|nr:PREDICTED: uncharacterized protein LOC106814363 [Priapulus caudatus]